MLLETQQNELGKARFTTYKDLITISRINLSIFIPGCKICEFI